MFNNINSARFVLSTVVLAIFMFIYQMIVHGHMLMPYYMATPQLWRPEADMQAMVGWCLTYKLLFSAALTFLFTRHFEGKGMDEGVRFGVYLGLILGIQTAASYLWMPVSGSLAIAWFVESFVFSILAGVILSMTYKK